MLLVVGHLALIRQWLASSSVTGFDPTTNQRWILCWFN